MNLQDYQRLFTEALHPSASNDVFLAAGKMLVQGGRLQVEDRLLVYRHNISGAYISALSTTFVVCQQILGKACFSAFARDYAWNRTNQSDDLNQLGDGFPLYLEKEIKRRAGFDDYSYIADMARLELLIERSAQSADSDLSQRIEDEKIANYASGSISPIFNKSLFLLETDYPVLSLWKKHQDKNDVLSVAGLDERDYLCVCRDKNDDVIIQNISDEYYEILVTSREASLHCLSVAVGVDLEITVFLQTAIEQAWIVGFRAS